MTPADTDIEFEAPGIYELEATVSNGITAGTTTLSVTVFLPGEESASLDPLAVPGNWIDSDIGNSNLGGSARNGGLFTLTAAGRDGGIGEGETYDDGRFYWKGVAGDFDITARLDSLCNASGPTRAGLMVRGGPGPTDAAAFIGFSPDGKLYSLFRQEGGRWGKEVWRAAPTVSGDYVTRFGVDDGNTVTYQERSAPIRFNIRYDFNLEGSAEEWTANNVSGLTFAGGAIGGSASTADPQLIRSGLSLNGNSFTRVMVRMKSNLNSPVQLFWGREGAGGFANERRVSAIYSGGGNYQTLVFDLLGVDQWSDETITGLRIDPLEGASASGKVFEIDFIEISDGQLQRVSNEVVVFCRCWTRNTPEELNGSLQSRMAGTSSQARAWVRTSVRYGQPSSGKPVIRDEMKMD